MLLKTFGAALARPVIIQSPRHWETTTAAAKTRNQPPSIHNSLLNPIRYQTTAAMSRSQAVDAGLSRSATFLVFSVVPTDSSIQSVRGVLSSIPDMAKNISIRDVNANLTCVVGIGSRAWDSLTRLPRPDELHPFPEVRGAKQTAVSTPGDLLFHIRSERRDMCFELERQLVEKLGDAVRLEDHTEGFRYFDARDLLGFVDGTANPVGADVADAVMVSSDATAAAVGGSYVVVQKYLHDLKAWKALSTEQQEAIIGRTKADNVELDDAEDGLQQAHKTLATIEDGAGEHAILRDNMPFGSPSTGQYGTYFIAYSRHLWVVEKMMERMFVGHPPGLHDRILEFSTPVTGSTFFAPSLSSLKALGDE
ncbi:Dyp-type peroxidase [Xylaria sp. FL1777]|nr:Dyp-type peroxidase [Xylaria sp. FL1777]